MQYINIYGEDNKSKIEKAKKDIEDILGKKYEVRLRITDYRVNHFSFYGKVSNKDYKKIVSFFPEAEKKVKWNGKIISITVHDGVWGLGTGFTLYNVSERKKNRLIEQHDKEHVKMMEYIRNNGIIF